jgi:hypothetical protein
MKYVSIDLETTGLDPDFDQILEVGAIIEDTKTKLPFEEVPKIHFYVRHESYRASHPYALWLNSRIFEILAKHDDLTKKQLVKELDEEEVDWMHEHNVCTLQEVNVNIANFMALNGVNNNDFANVNGVKVPHIIPAGKNFDSFDRQFLKNAPEFNRYKLAHRGIDMGGQFINWEKDKRVPSFDQCLERAGIDKIVSHKALDDAWDVIRALRTKY